MTTQTGVVAEEVERSGQIQEAVDSDNDFVMD